MPLHMPVQVASGAELEAAGGAEETDLVLRGLRLLLLLRVHHQVAGFNEELTLVEQVGLVENGGVVALALPVLEQECVS